jgi:transcription initiation protein SPT3
LTNIYQLSVANGLAARRRKRAISLNDIIFQVRHDIPRVARIQTLLRWRAIRLEAKKRNKDTEGDADMDEEELSEDTLESPTVEDAALKKTEPAAAILPWDVKSFFSIIPPGGDTNERLLDESSEDSLERLRWADEMTKDMTREEYAKWASYRNASFTTRKAKRFREWAGVGAIAHVIKKEDTLEILGFLAAEMVKRLTDIALTIQAQDSTAHQRQNGQSVEALGQRRHGMFVPLKTERPPIDVVHIQRAFDETQMKPKRRRVKLNRIAGPKTLELI